MAQILQASAGTTALSQCGATRLKFGSDGPKWSSAYRQFRRWTLAGVSDVLLAALNESGEGQDSVPMIDSTIVRAHQHAAGAQKKRALSAKVLAAREVAS